MEISKAEFDVLEAIWQGHPCSASDIIQRLEQHKSWHEKTVKTLISRLVKKGALGFNKEQRKYLYYPLIEKQQYQISESQNLLGRLFGGKVSSLVASFANSKDLDKQDIAELKKLIQDWEQKHD